MTKAELREIFLEKRRSLSAADVALMSRAIAERFFQTVDLSTVTNISTFIRIAKFNEVDTSAIYYRLWRDRPDMRTFAPRADLKAHSIESVRFDESTDFVENRWGVREPSTGETAPVSDLDMVIVPLLCIDTAGNRLGYGKGFYDRYLSECRRDCIKVGLSYFSPCDAIPEIGTHDVKLDLCVTPEETYRF